MYDLIMAMQVTRIVHEERLAAAQNQRRHDSVQLTHLLDLEGPFLSQARKAMNRVMSLLF